MGGAAALRQLRLRDPIWTFSLGIVGACSAPWPVPGGGAEIWQWLFPMLIEMFEHMMNWRELMTRVRSWLAPHGRFFMHIFTGDVTPRHHLIRQYANIFSVEKEWRWSGTRYARMANDWLDNRSPSQRDRTHPSAVYGRNTAYGCGAGAGSFCDRRFVCLCGWKLMRA
jgi:hypothetical protein